MEQLKHECGVAVIRLLKPLEYYYNKYGTYAYGLNLLYLLMEKQHNRGQEAAGIGVVKIDTIPGHEYVFRERALGANAITEIFSQVMPKISPEALNGMSADEIATLTPFLGQVMMGHLRYSTTGKSGLSYVHPFLRRNNWKSRNLLLCGNFNLTNVDEIFRSIVKQGQHPRIYADTVLLLEQLGYMLDKECHRLYRLHRDANDESLIEQEIEREMDIANILSPTADMWDGGYVICGATGSGDTFVLRDPHGIRPAFYYQNDELVVIASEKPAIQTVLDVHFPDVEELRPGSAIIINRQGNVEIRDILGERENKRCSFERIYFSRGSDRDIYRERKQLGRLLTPQILKAIDNDLENTVFSFIPNTAEVAFIGMVEGLEKHADELKAERILALQREGQLDSDSLQAVMAPELRIEKIAIKDIKLRTFIAEGAARDGLAAHVYDVTYGCINNYKDTLVVIDDSIVRGTTLRQSIIKMLDRLGPKKIVIVSSSPQVRYPDYYGIDMSRMAEFIAFRAAISLLRKRGLQHVIDDVYHACLAQRDLPAAEQTNCVKAIYEPFTDEDINAEIVNLVKPEGTQAEVELVYQTVENLHATLPGHPGDWYFSGDYPTPGGVRLVNLSFINWYEGHPDAR